MAIICWGSFMLFFASNALAIPALSSILTVNQANLTQGLNSNTSLAAAALFNPSSPQPNEAIVYRVPNTPTSIRFELKSTPLNPDAMNHAIIQTQVKLRRFISTHYHAADDVLFRSDDPYMSDQSYVGCFFAVTHWPPTRQKRLTYGTVENVLRGVREFMYQGGRFVCADFYVKDDEKGTVGFGNLLSKSPGRVAGDVAEG